MNRHILAENVRQMTPKKIAKFIVVELIECAGCFLVGVIFGYMFGHYF